MTRVRIKFCGITNLDDARAAVALGADALGFVFYPPSPRFISPEAAAAIIRALPPLVSKVGLFVNASAAEVEATVSATGIDLVQFHGDEPAAQCSLAPRPWIKALRMREDSDVAAFSAEYAGAAALLLDAYTARVYGGSGERFDWSLIPATVPLPWILAGGLDADNVAAAIRRTRPYAVDVSGGIEARKGIKDPDKMQRFISEVTQFECHS